MAPARAWTASSSPANSSWNACCPKPPPISPASRRAPAASWNSQRRHSEMAKSKKKPAKAKAKSVAKKSASNGGAATRLARDAFVYDHVRTPRGRGKSDGALHEVTALNLASQALGAIKSRNNLDTALVDDVVMGVVDPVGEAGSDIARFAALKAGLGQSVPGVQISRFCASGLDAANFAPDTI